jgi:hypothetical protein
MAVVRVTVKSDFRTANQWKRFFNDDSAHVRHRVKVLRSGSIETLVLKFTVQPTEQAFYLPYIAFDVTGQRRRLISRFGGLVQDFVQVLLQTIHAIDISFDRLRMLVVLRKLVGVFVQMTHDLGKPVSV